VPFVTSRLFLVGLTLLGLTVFLSALQPVQAVAEEMATDLSSEGAEPEEANLGLVPRALFTLTISNREPGEELTEFTADQRKVIFFTELGDLTGQRVIHRWEHNGKVMAEVGIDVGGSPWRAYSVKKLRPDWVGECTVSVVDSQGRVLSSRSFSYLAEPLEKETHAGLE